MENHVLLGGPTSVTHTHTHTTRGYPLICRHLLGWVCRKPTIIHVLVREVAAPELQILGWPSWLVQGVINLQSDNIGSCLKKSNRDLKGFDLQHEVSLLFEGLFTLVSELL